MFIFLFTLFKKNLNNISFIDISIFSCFILLPKVYSFSEPLQILLSSAIIKNVISNNVYTKEIENQVFISGAKLTHIFYPNYIFNNSIFIAISFLICIYIKLEISDILKNLILFNGLGSITFVFKHLFFNTLKMNSFLKKIIESIFFYSIVSIFIFSLKIFFWIALFFIIMAIIIAHNKTLNFNDLHKKLN